MASTAKLTLEEFLAQPETKPYREFWDGEVTVKPMPTLPHGIIEGLLGFVFWSFLRINPIGTVGPEIRCIMQRQGRRWAPVPDFIFVSNARLGSLPLAGPLQGAPDLAVEILSPDDDLADAMAKPRDYFANGVRLAWLIDPDRRTVLVMTGPEQMQLLTMSDTLDGGDVIPGFRVAVRDIFPPALTAVP